MHQKKPMTADFKVKHRANFMEPEWYELTHRKPAATPDKIYPWLKDDGSLTKRLISHCSGQFSVSVRQQQTKKPFNSERQILAMQNAKVAFIREVELRCNNQPWVFARTLIPMSSLSGAARRLAYLGNKPLGALLFANPSTKRGLVQIARLLPRHSLFSIAVENLKHKPDELWARRTLFWYEKKPLLVNEVFLPGIDRF